MRALKGRGSGNLLMIEMIAALFFFSISGAVILQVFAAAHTRSGENAVREKAILCAQSVAEAYSVSGSAEQACELVFGEKPQVNGDKLVLQLDELVTLTMNETRSESESGELSQLNMSFAAGSGELFEVSCSAYVSGGAADE